MKSCSGRILLWFASIAMILKHCASSVQTLRQDFYQVKNELPENIFGDMLQIHDSMLESIESISDYLGVIGNSFILPKEEEFVTTGTHAIDLHTDVIFVGFPSTALDAIREKWLESLFREDDFVVSVGGDRNVVKLPGSDIKIRHNIHLVQVSFHVADVIKERLKLMLRRYEDILYVNAWEMEDILSGLKMSVEDSQSHSTINVNGVEVLSKNAKHLSRSAVFVLNFNILDSFDKPIQFKYMNGFIGDDLSILATSPDIVSKSEALLKGEKKPKRLDLEKDIDAISIARINVPGISSIDLIVDGTDDSALEGEDSEKPDDVASNPQKPLVHSRDAVKETRTWATSFSTDSKALGKLSLEGRAERILQADPSSALGSYRLTLAKAVLAAANGRDYSTRCAAGTWVGAGPSRIVFKDIHAIESTGSIPLHAMGTASAHPAPRAIDEQEWLRLGQGASSDPTVAEDSSAPHGAGTGGGFGGGGANIIHAGSSSLIGDMREELVKARAAVQRHLQSVEAILDQTDACHEESLRILKLLSASTAPQMGGFHRGIMPSISAQLVLDIAHGNTRDFCAVLILQRELLNSTLYASRVLDTQRLAIGAREDADDFADAIKDLSWFHARTLYQVLDSSNILMDTSYLHADKISEQTTVYLGYLSSFILKSVRYNLSPPMMVSADPTLARRQRKSPAQAQAQAQQQILAQKSAAVEKNGIKKPRNSETLLEFVKASGTDFIASYETEASIGGQNAAAALVQSEEPEELPPDEARRRKDEELHMWLSLLPQVAFAPRLDIVVYVVRAQSEYEPLAETVGGDPGFDVWTFMKEAGRLKLPGQQASITMHQVDAVSEQGLGLGLAACRRLAVTPFASLDDHTHRYHMSNGQTNYLDAECLLTHIQHYDNEAEIVAGATTSLNDASSRSSSKSKNSKSGKARQASSVGKAPGSKATNNLPDKADWFAVSRLENLFGALRAHEATHHVPVFVLSVATDSPTYLDGSLQATWVGGAVVVIQNKQQEIPSQLKCGGVRIALNGRNPLAESLAALGAAVGGLFPSHLSHTQTDSGEGSLRISELVECSLSRSRGAAAAAATYSDCGASGGRAGQAWELWDWSFMGASPTFDVTSFTVPRFSSFDIDFIHRARALKSLGICRMALRSLLPAEARGFGKVAQALDEAFAALQVSDWSLAATLANAAFSTLSLEALRHALAGSPVGGSTPPQGVGAAAEGDRDRGQGGQRSQDTEGLQNSAVMWIVDAIILIISAGVQLLAFPIAVSAVAFYTFMYTFRYISRLRLFRGKGNLL